MRKAGVISLKLFNPQTPCLALSRDIVENVVLNDGEVILNANL